MRKLLESVNRDKLFEFLVEYAENDDKFANAVSVRFGEPVFDDELDKIEHEIDRALSGVSDYRTHDSWGNANFYTGDIIAEIHERASQGHARLAFAETELLYRKLLELFEYQGECEISDEAEYCISIMSDIGDGAVSADDKEYIFQHCIEMADLEDAKNYGADYEDKLLRIAVKFVTMENREELEQALACFDNGRREEEFALIRLELVRTFESPEATVAYIAENLRFPKIRELAFDNAISQKEYEQAQQLCLDALSIDTQRYGTSPWLYKLYSVYVMWGKESDMANTAKRILLSGDLEYYDKLKRHLQKQGKWDDQYHVLLCEFSTKLYYSWYMKILEKEQEYALLLEQLKIHTEQVYSYGKTLAIEYPADVCAIFISQINSEAESAHKRGQYRDVSYHIAMFSKAGYKAEAMELVKELKEKNSRKPAFVDELRKI